MLYPTVGDVMTKTVVSVEPSTPFKAIVELLLRLDIDGVPVLDVGDRLIGVVTEADLLSKESFGPQQAKTLHALFPDGMGADTPSLTKADALTAGELMTSHPTTCGPDEDLKVVARRMLRERRHQLPVVQDDRVVGILARRDILSVFDRDDSDIAAAVASALRNNALLPEAHEITARVEDGVVHLTGTVSSPSDVAVIRAALGSIAGVVDVVGEPGLS